MRFFVALYLSWCLCFKKKKCSVVSLAWAEYNSKKREKWTENAEVSLEHFIFGSWCSRTKIQHWEQTQGNVYWLVQNTVQHSLFHTLVPPMSNKRIVHASPPLEHCQENTETTAPQPQQHSTLLTHTRSVLARKLPATGVTWLEAVKKDDVLVHY